MVWIRFCGCGFSKVVQSCLIQGCLGSSVMGLVREFGLLEPYFHKIQQLLGDGRGGNFFQKVTWPCA